MITTFGWGRGPGSQGLAAAPYTMSSRRFRRTSLRSCAGSTNCIWTIRSRAAGCCATCCVAIGHELVATMMRRMGIEAIYRKPNTSKAAQGHKIYPYLLRWLAIERANQDWAMDITSIPMARGFVHLASVVDWFSRWLLSWQRLITMDVDFCLGAVEETLARYGRAGNFQYRSRFAVHPCGLQGAAAGERYRREHGWPWCLPRQLFCRAPLAVGKI